MAITTKEDLQNAYLNAIKKSPHKIYQYNEKNKIKSVKLADLTFKGKRVEDLWKECVKAQLELVKHKNAINKLLMRTKTNHTHDLAALDFIFPLISKDDLPRDFFNRYYHIENGEIVKDVLLEEKFKKGVL